MKRNIIIFALIGLIIGAYFILNSVKPLLNDKFKNETQFVRALESQKPKSPSAELSDHAKECDELKKTFAQMPHDSAYTLRFSNVHKSIGKTIYRLRHFFKDGDENEIETFLVYKEDSQERASIVEKSTRTKGSHYLKIENAPGQIIYHEEGYSSTDEVFLHYINNKLEGLQSDETDCKYQQE
jgi:hypothetical protein